MRPFGKKQATERDVLAVAAQMREMAAEAHHFIWRMDSDNPQLLSVVLGDLANKLDPPASAECRHCRATITYVITPDCSGYEWVHDGGKLICPDAPRAEPA